MSTVVAFPGCTVPATEPEAAMPYEAAVWLTFPSFVTTKEQAEEWIASALTHRYLTEGYDGPRFTEWDWVANYYGEKCTPRNDGNHPDFA
jgi:hypothetical protein